ncbi:MAG: FadR family transcriptional regulator [Deltaproteobacteria bacterium]|nr:FadR family transcriptional regulator [Deltaproteobacteria bacterium]MBW2129947.1 FadR family transcriptional regulator [Deltaproteobacteria bacterium]
MDIQKGIDPVFQLQPLKRTRLSERIVEQIKDLIYAGSFKPGDKLPSQDNLCEIFGVGKPVVREALQSLEHTGLITIRPGSGGGAFVKRISSTVLSDTFEGIIHLDQVSMEQLTEARLTVEMASLPLIIERIQPDDLAALEQNMKDARNGLQEGFKEPKNLGFHILLARATHNPLIIRITQGLFRVLAKMLENHDYSYDRKKKVLEEHEYLFVLLKEKKYDELEKTLDRHIRDTLCFFKPEEYGVRHLSRS